MKTLTDYNPGVPKVTNFEHYRDELLKIVAGNGGVAITDSKPSRCSDTICRDCLGYNTNCDTMLIEWGFHEYKEPLQLSLAEHCFLGAIETGYIIRDNHNQLFWCETPPSKVDGIWEVQSGDMVNLNFLKCMQLPFVKYEGTSWSVEQLYDLPYDNE